MFRTAIEIAPTDRSLSGTSTQASNSSEQPKTLRASLQGTFNSFNLPNQFILYVLPYVLGTFDESCLRSGPAE